jgi:LacI family transcriptional regulator
MPRPNTTITPNRARIVDVARKAAVSRAAVSAVLNGGSHTTRVSEKTAAKIRRVAKELNYHPNHVARQLAGKRGNVVGVLGNWKFAPVAGRFLPYVNHLAAEKGYRIFAWESSGSIESIESYLDESLGRGIEGILYLAFDNDASWPEMAPRLARIPHVVSVLGDPGVPSGSCVLSQPAEGVRQVIEHLYAVGRQKIAFVLENMDTGINRQRAEAIRTVHGQLHRALEPDYLCVATQGWTENDGEKYDALCKELVGDRQVDAIAADSDYSAIMLMRSLRRLGRHVPEDVAVVGFGNDLAARWCDPLLTTVDYRVPVLVETALDLLIKRLEGHGSNPPQTVIIEPQLLVRESA